MDNKKLKKLLDRLKVPVAYNSFKTPRELPYILFVQSGSDNFGADNKVYKRVNNYNIEVYASDKDFELEAKLEDLLDENEIYWEKSGDIRIEEEKVTEVVYYI